MATYRMSLASAASAATLAVPFSHLWNPHTTKRLRVTEIHLANTTAVATNVGILRTSTIGTTPTTALATAVIAQAHNKDIAAASGAQTNGGTYATAPVCDTNTAFLERAIIPATIGAGIFFTFPVDEAIEIPPGQGLALCAATAVATAATITTFVWRE